MPRASGRGKLGRFALRATVAGVLAFAGLELAARALCGTATNGMPRAGRFPLLPFRPTEAIVRANLERNAHSTYVIADPELGWTISASGMSPDAHGAPQYESNSQGIRAAPDHVYAPHAPPGRVRIVTLGDSFTHCDEVRNDETWQSALEQRRAELEVLNLGVPGYGTDQALLRWRRDARELGARIVILGIWPENMCRNLNVVRYYLVPTEQFTSKPRLIEDGAELKVVNSPVLQRAEMIATLTEPESHPLLAHDAWYDESETRWRWFQCSRTVRIAQSLYALRERKRTRQQLYDGTDPAGIELTVAIAAQFQREARAAGATPLVLLIPMRDLLPMHTAEREFPLVAALRARGVDVLDLGPAFGRRVLERGVDSVYAPEGHHTPEGNRLFAEQLGQQLEPWIEAARRKAERL